SIGLIAGMALLAFGLAFSSLGLLLAGGIVAGLGQGSSFRHGLGAINEASPPQRRGEVASGFFVISYLGISLPVVGVGLVGEAAAGSSAGDRRRTRSRSRRSTARWSSVSTGSTLRRVRTRPLGGGRRQGDRRPRGAAVHLHEGLAGRGARPHRRAQPEARLDP